jgi:hypothetical protein
MIENESNIKEENEKTDKMQDLEQHIMECWQLVDDVKLLYEQVMDKDLHEDQDRLANALLGLYTIYGMKFSLAFDTYEEALEHHYNLTDEASTNTLSINADQSDDQPKLAEEIISPKSSKLPERRLRSAL